MSRAWGEMPPGVGARRRRTSSLDQILNEWLDYRWRGSELDGVAHERLGAGAPYVVVDVQRAEAHVWRDRLTDFD